MNELFEYFKLYTVKQVHFPHCKIYYDKPLYKCEHNGECNNLEYDKKYIIVYAEENSGYNILGINYINKLEFSELNYEEYMYYKHHHQSHLLQDVLTLHNGYYFTNNEKHNNPTPNNFYNNSSIKLYQLVDDFQDTYAFDLISTHYDESTMQKCNICVYVYEYIYVTNNGRSLNSRETSISSPVLHLTGKKNINNKTNIIPYNRM